MSTEELLRTRYKVTKYPHYPFDGDVLIVSYEGELIHETEGYCQSAYKIMESDVASYPKNFRKLEWWEERDFDFAGMHVRFGELDKPHSYYKLVHKFEQPYEELWKMEGRSGEYSFPLNDSFPATLEEYNAFKSGKP